MFFFLIKNMTCFEEKNFNNSRSNFVFMNLVFPDSLRNFDIFVIFCYKICWDLKIKLIICNFFLIGEFNYWKFKTIQIMIFFLNYLNIQTLLLGHRSPFLNIKIKIISNHPHERRLPEPHRAASRERRIQ